MNEQQLRACGALPDTCTERVSRVCLMCGTAGGTAEEWRRGGNCCAVCGNETYRDECARCHGANVSASGVGGRPCVALDVYRASGRVAFPERLTGDTRKPVPTVSNSAGSTQTGRPGAPSPSAQTIEVRLRELLAKHGPGLCTDTRRCESMIRDICGDKTKEAHLLIQALKRQVPTDLIGMPPGTAPLPTLRRLRQRLEDSFGMAESAARWAVNSWALAVGSVTADDLQSEAIPGVYPVVAGTQPSGSSILAPDGTVTLEEPNYFDFLKPYMQPPT